MITAANIIDKLPLPPRRENRLVSPLLREVKKIIRSGSLTPGSRLPPVRTLAREHKISYSTALHAVEQLEREGLVERFQGRGTFVKGGAASQTGATRHDNSWVSLILDDRQHVVGNLNTELLRHLMQTPWPAYDPIVNASDEQRAREAARMWRQSPPHAVITTNVNQQLAELILHQCPVGTRVIVLLLSGFLHPGWHSVCPDYAAAGHLAADHLIRRGHKHIGVLSKRRSVVERWKHTYRKAWMPQTHLILGVGHTLRAAGIEHALTINYNAPVNNDPSGVPVDEENVSAMAKWLTGPNAPTAVITDDFRVIGLRKAAARAGRRVGEDLHVVGIGASSLVHNADHPCVDLRFDLIAKEAAALVACDESELRDAARHVFVPPSWVENQV